MDMFHAHRFNAFYRIAADAEPGARERLDRVLDEVVDHALEDALVHVPIGEDEEVCIRTIHVPFAVGGVESDSNIADRWALEILHALNAKISLGNSTEVVRYPTRRHAIVELAHASVTGDCSRAWAWRQLDLWHGPTISNPATALKEMLRALVSEPEAILPVLLSLAHGDRLLAFILLLEDVDWEILTTSALVGAGAFLELLDAPSQIEESNTTHMASQGPEILGTVAQGILSRSKIAQTGLAAGKNISSRGMHSLSLLGVLEADPSKLQGNVESAQCLVAAVYRGFEGKVQDFEEEANSIHENSSSEEITSSNGLTPADDRAKTQSNTHNLSLRPSHLKDRASTNFDSAVLKDKAPIDEVTQPGEQQTLNGEGNSVESRNDAYQSLDHDPDISDDEQEWDDQFPIRRQRGYTEYGGLLYLLNILDAHGIAEAAANDEYLQSRLLRWVLHRLALTLLPIDPRDPAALAFAGLTPESDSPAEEEDPPTPFEQMAIDGLAYQVREALRRLCNWDNRSDAMLLDRVCHHFAEIIADPGWIEVHFSFEEISTEIRRSGLDANPDYIPWLGTVVKFVYE